VKIGILSLTSGYNFGGTLQTWALAQSLTRLGHEPIVIDYHPAQHALLRWWRGWGISTKISLDKIRHRAWELSKSPGHIRKYQLFKQKHLTFTRPCYTPAQFQETIQTFDAVVVGSDQVWNLQYHPDPVFYLAGMDSFKGLRVSYAACCGNPAQGFPEWVSPGLQAFHAVSVRNRFTADWVKRCTAGQIDPLVVADPTLLTDEFPEARVELPAKYIAAYNIGEGNPENHHCHIASLRRIHGNLPVVCLMPTAIALRKHSWHDQVLWNLDPFEWISVIKHSTAVYTDSYHAILFALRNHVPLIATYTEAVRAPRLVELREELGLHGSVFHEDASPDINSTPDWQSVAARFARSRDLSLHFLESTFTKLSPQPSA
jgi:hypothetical protein